MPRKAQFPPKLHTHRGRARVKWQGRWHDCGKAGTDAADRKYRRMLLVWRDDPTAPVRDTEGLSVAGLCAAYQAAQSYPPGERLQITRAIELLLDLHLDTPCKDFGPLALGAWQRELAGRTKPHRLVGAQQQLVPAPLYTRSYISKLIRIVRMIFKWGVATERITAEQHAALMSVPGLRAGQGKPPRRKRIVGDGDFERTVAALPGAARRLVRVLRLTGARPSELFRLKALDLDRSGDVWVFTPGQHKTSEAGRERPIGFGPRAQAALVEGLEGDGSDGYFVHEGGRFYNRNSLRQAVHRACRRAKVERWNPYDMRHTRATEVRRRFGLEAAQVLLGHSRADVTQVYAQRDFTLAEKVARETG